MPRLQHALDLRRRRNHHRRIFHGEIQQLDVRYLHEIAAHRIRDQHGVIDDLGLPEGFHPLFESPDDGEGKSRQLDGFAYCGLRRSVDLDRHLLGDYSNFVVSLRILLIEESSGRHNQVAHPHIFGIDAEYGDVFLFAVAHRNAVGELADGRRSDNSGNDLLHSVQIVNGERVGIGIADVGRAAEILRPDFIRADGLYLIQDELPARHADRNHQNQRGSADHHA